MCTHVHAAGSYKVDIAAFRNLNQAVPQAQQQPGQAAGDAAPVQPAAPNQAAEGQAQDAQVQPPQPLQPQVQGAGDAPQQDANVPKGKTLG